MLNKLIVWWRALFRRNRVQSEMDEELALHLELEIESNLRRGMSSEEARAAALRSFGGVAQIREECRDIRLGTRLETLWQDLRFGARMLRRSPAFTCATVLTLALGIGANTAIFSVVNGVLFRPLPYPEPDRLIYVKNQSPYIGVNPYTWGSEFVAWKNTSRSLGQIAAYNQEQGNFTGAGEAERIAYGLATASLFPLLGVQPVLGRGFLPGEDQRGSALVTILSHRLWQRRFGSDPSVLGKALNLDGKSYTIIGVLPAGFQVTDAAQIDCELWVPLVLDPKAFIGVRTIGRLAPGASVQQAESELDTILQNTLSEVQKKRAPRHAIVVPWHDQVAGSAKVALLTFMVAVGFVLLIACVNVANLLLARAAVRHQEVAIRRALGAGKWRVVRQLLTESVLLSVIGGLIGMALAYWGKDGLIAFIAHSLPGIPPIGIDHRVLGFNLALAFLTGIAFGLAPALHASGIGLNESLKEGGRGAVGGRRRHYVRNLLVISEIALATVLLLGAGLLLKSFLRLRGIDPGFRPDRVLTMAVYLTESQYANPAAQASFFQQVQQRVQALGGVKAVGLTACPPLGTGYSMTASGVDIEGRPDSDDDGSWAQHVSFTVVNADFFRALNIPLVRGRLFSDADAAAAPGVAVVNQAFLRRYFANGENPVGRRLKTPFQRNEWLTIVGVVGDVRQEGLDEAVTPMVYRSYLQAGTPMMTVLVRTAGDPMALAGSVRGQVATVDKDQPPYDISNMEELLSNAVTKPRTNMLLVGAFAALALALASVGIYGVVAYGVAERTHEIGIRIALGATRLNVMQMIVGRGVVLAIVGIAVGLGAAFALTRLIASMLFGVSATDLSTFATVPLLMIATVLLASYLPSRKATAIDPMSALRCE